MPSVANAGGIAPPFKVTITEVLSFFWNIIKPYKWQYIVMIILPLLTNFYILFTNLALKYMVDNSLNIEEKGYWGLIYPVLIFVAAESYTVIFSAIHRYLEWHTEPKVRKEIIIRSYAIIQKKAYNFFHVNHSGTIMSKLSSILEGYDTLWGEAHYAALTSIVTLIIALGSLFYINVKMGFLMFLWAAIMLIAHRYVKAKIKELSRLENHALHRIIGFVADLVTNFLSIFAFATSKKEIKGLANHIDNDYIPKQHDLSRFDLYSSAILDTMAVFMFGSALALLAYLIKCRQVTPGEIAFVFSILHTVMERVNVLGKTITNIMRNFGGLLSAFAILKEGPELLEPADNQVVSKISPVPLIEFQNVNFSYKYPDTASENHPPDTTNSPSTLQSSLSASSLTKSFHHQIFKNINLTIKPGERIGIVGPSGGGKSTLMHLLLRYFEIDSGKIMLDGIDIRNLKIDTLRSTISILHQDFPLFNRSIYDNIIYGSEDASPKKISTIMQQIGLNSVVSKLSHRHSHKIGDKITGISGGQKQRIGLARILLKNSGIIILDEATSALDTKSEKDIQKILKKQLGIENNTLIVISHRLSTIKDMDRILVVLGNGLIEEGTHQELMRSSPTYQLLWKKNIE